MAGPSAPFELRSGARPPGKLLAQMLNGSFWQGLPFHLSHETDGLVPPARFISDARIISVCFS